MSDRRRPNLRVDVGPPAGEPVSNPFKFTPDGGFHEGNLAINSRGLVINATGGSSGDPQQTQTEESSAAAAPSIHDLLHASGGIDGSGGAPRRVLQPEALQLSELRVLEVLGSGSAGVVRRAIHAKSGTVVALKIVKLALDEAVRRQTLLELQTLYRIRSPHVVQFYDAFLVDGVIHIALEYMDAGTLRDLVRHGPISEPVLAKISEQVLSGLASLHKLHFIHRDIKPTNLLVNTRGQVKIADFGVCGMKDHTLSTYHSIIGTVTYMSPERISAQSYKADSDIWSFGLTILECATGAYPYNSSRISRPTTAEAARARPVTPAQSLSDSTVLELMNRIVTEPAPEAPSTSSPEFREFISACLQKEPRDRPTATALLKHKWITKRAAEGASVAAWVRAVTEHDFDY